MGTREVATERVVAGAAATLSFQGVDQYGEPADPGGVTVGIVRADGTTLLAGGTATSGTTTSPRTVALTAAQTAELDRLTATWTTTSGTTVGVTKIDVVGGVYVSQAVAGAVEPTLASPTTSAAVFRQARTEVEQMIEDHCKRAFVPRFASETQVGDGGCHLFVGWPYVRSVSWLRIDDVDVTDLSDIDVHRSPGAIYRTAGWPCGSTIEIGYEHGLDNPPADLQRATIHAIRYQTNSLKSGITDRAISYQPVEGGNIVIATPGLGRWVTGIPAVDEVLNRYREPGGIA